MQNKQYTLKQIADFLKAELRGDENYLITSLAPLDKAAAGQISFFGKAAGFAATMGDFLAETKAGAVILASKDAETYKGNALIAPDPYVAYARLSSWFSDVPEVESGIHAQAIVGDNCDIADSAGIAANCVIGNDVKIGANTVISPGCVIGDDTVIGADCRLFPNVTVYHKINIGNRVIIHGGAVIGADGFGMANDKGTWVKIQQLGSVIIGDDVEIGANTCIDRGALEDTIVENGVKLDNLIQVGHNAKIGAHTAIAGCTVIAGSAVIGRYCMIGGAVAINGHINIPDQTIITGASTVGLTIEKPGIYSSGLTVQPHRQWLKTLVAILKLHKLSGKIKELENM